MSSPMARASPASSVPHGQEGLAELCRAHGFELVELDKQAAKLKAIDLFESNDVDGGAFKPFINVREISVIHAPRLSKMFGFTSMHLTRLLLVECGIKIIEGLESCSNLTTLNLDGNHISKISGLNGCSKLQNLWLNDNRISVIEGIRNCVSLSELHLARNRIAHIGPELAHNTALSIINLADNSLESFQEIGALSTMPSLTDVTFSDPHWGENPICTLCNYSIYMLYQLPRLERLDGEAVSPDSKLNAESTFMKKRMYYSMRNKTLRRNISTFIQSATLGYMCFQHLIGTSCIALQDQLKTVTGLLACGVKPDFELPAEIARDATPSAQDGEEKRPESAYNGLTLDALKRQLNSQYDRRVKTLGALERSLTSLRTSASTMLRAHALRMDLELYSGGNVRLEDGRPSVLLSLDTTSATQSASAQADPWVASVTDLLRGRFSTRDYGSLRVAGVRVTRVLRVHNRVLRARFEKRMAQIFAAQPGLQAALTAMASSGESTPSTLSPKTKKGTSADKEGFSPSKLTQLQSGGKRGIEYLMYVPPWGRDSIEMSVSRQQSAQRMETEPTDALSSMVSEFEGSMQLSRIFDATTQEEFLSADFNSDVRRVVEHGFSAADATIAVPAAALTMEDCIPTAPTYAPPDASFGPASTPAAKPKTEGRPLEASQHLLPVADAHRAFAIPVSSSLSCVDLPRLAEAIACEVCSASESARRKESTNGPSEAYSALSATAARRRQTETTTVRSWIKNAGMDQSDISVQARIEAAAAQPERRAVFRKGIAIIAKSFSGNVLDLVNNSTTLSHAPEDVQRASAAAAAAGLLGTGASSVHSVSYMRQDDNRQRVQAFLDPSLLLPEFVVEYEYVFEGEEDESLSPEENVFDITTDQQFQAALAYELSMLKCTQYAKTFDELIRNAPPCSKRFEYFFQVLGLLKKGRISAGLHISLIRELAATAIAYGTDTLKDAMSRLLLCDNETADTDLTKLLMLSCPKHGLSAQEEGDMRFFVQTSAPFAFRFSDMLRFFFVLPATSASSKSGMESSCKLFDLQAWQTTSIARWAFRTCLRKPAADVWWSMPLAEFGTLLVLKQMARRTADIAMDADEYAVEWAVDDVRSVAVLAAPSARVGPRTAGISDAVKLIATFNIVELTLKGCGLTDLSLLSFGTTNALVQKLDVSFNALTSLDHVVRALHLTTIDASNNQITALTRDGSALEDCTAMLHLNLCGNKISRLLDLHPLTMHCPTLSSLDLRWNPITCATSKTPSSNLASSFHIPAPIVYPMLMHWLPFLQQLDGKRIAPVDRTRLSSLKVCDFTPLLDGSAAMSARKADSCAAILDLRWCMTVAGVKLQTRDDTPSIKLYTLFPEDKPRSINVKLPETFRSYAEVRLKEVASSISRSFLPNDSLSAIATLDLSHCMLSGLSLFAAPAIAAFAQLPCLQSVMLDNNCLSFLVLPIPSTVGQSFTLTDSNVHAPEFKAAISCLVWLKRASSLSLRSCDLESLAYQEPDSWERVVVEEDPSAPANRPIPTPLLMWLNPISSMGLLQKLDLSDNRLTDDALISAKLWLLPKLQQLSVDNNQLTSFAALKGCKGLMELYCSNNLIGSHRVGTQTARPPSDEGGERPRTASALTATVSGSSPLRMLQGLRPEYFPRLIIADFTGNAICQEPAYREYAIYHVRRLKVLDGAGVSTDESASVRDKYSGRLTLEFLEERLASGACNSGIPADILSALSNNQMFTDEVPVDGAQLTPLDLSTIDVAVVYHAIKELDLASCRIRDIELIPAGLFKSLKVLNLDHNNLTSDSLKGLMNLSSLHTLSLNHNKVHSLLPALGLDEEKYAKRVMLHPASRYTSSFLHSIEVLNMSHNTISDFEVIGLEFLARLRSLDLSNNEATRISGLQTCNTLRQLNLEGNNIRAVDPDSLNACTQLVELRLGDNGLKSLANVDGCPRLQALSVASNRISEISELDLLSTATLLQEISLVNNPVTRKAGYRIAAILRLPQLFFLDGKEITAEERQRAELAVSQMGVPAANPAAGFASSASMAVSAGPTSGAAAMPPGALWQFSTGQQKDLAFIPMSATQLLASNATYQAVSGSTGNLLASPVATSIMPGNTTSATMVDKALKMASVKLPAGGMQGSFGLTKYANDPSVLPTVAPVPTAGLSSLSVTGLNINGAPSIPVATAPARSTVSSVPSSSSGPAGIPPLPGFTAMTSLLLRTSSGSSAKWASHRTR